jgi:hypothetical protein
MLAASNVAESRSKEFRLWIMIMCFASLFLQAAVLGCLRCTDLSRRNTKGSIGP